MAELVFTLPDLGEGLEEAEVVAWKVAPGDRVELNQPLVEVNTEKALVEIPSPCAGVVLRLHAEPGQVVRVGAPLVTFEVEERAAVLVGHGPQAEAPPRRRIRLRPPEAEGEGERVPLRGTRRIVAERMARAWAEVPHVTTFLTVDATALEARRAELAEASGLRFSVLPIVIRALAEVCRREPRLNASFDARRGELVLHPACHVGVATDTPQGLVVPVVRDAGSKGVVDIARELGELVEAVRGGRARPEQLTGATITVSNVGTFGAEFGTPIVTPPQVAILAVGVIAPRALVVEGRVEARPAATLSLSFDHRALDGAEAGRALEWLRRWLEDPELLARLL